MWWNTQWTRKIISTRWRWGRNSVLLIVSYKRNPQLLANFLREYIINIIV